MNHKKIIVIGGGAAGMMAALYAAQDGAKVLLIEWANAVGGISTSGLTEKHRPWAWPSP